MLPVLRHVLQYLSVGSTKKKKVLAQMQRNDQNLFVLAGGVAEVSCVLRVFEMCIGNDGCLCHSDINAIAALFLGFECSRPC